MIATSELSEPFPVFPVLVAAVVAAVGLGVLLSLFRSSLRSSIRVPMPMMNTTLGRICICL